MLGNTCRAKKEGECHHSMRISVKLADTVASKVGISFCLLCHRIVIRYLCFQGHNRRTCTKYPREIKKKKTKRKTGNWKGTKTEILQGGPSRFVGVSWNEGEGAWIASVTHGESPTRYLGSFRTEEEAARCFAQYVSVFGFR